MITRLLLIWLACNQHAGIRRAGKSVIFDLTPFSEPMPEPPDERFATERDTRRALEGYLGEMEDALGEFAALWEAAGGSPGRAEAAPALRRLAGRAELIELGLLWLEELESERL
jgi:hypothetical protein